MVDEETFVVGGGVVPMRVVDVPGLGVPLRVGGWGPVAPEPPVSPKHFAGEPPLPFDGDEGRDEEEPPLPPFDGDEERDEEEAPFDGESAGANIPRK